MDTLFAFCKRLHLGKLFTVFAAGFLLLLNVACSNGTATGARPNNPAVQMGGQNNPHKGGGDGYTEYQMSTDPAVKKRDRAELPGLGQLVANANQTERSLSDQVVSSRKNSNAGMTSSQPGNPMRDTVKEAKQIPEKPQEVLDRSDPNVKILEKVGDTFKEASKHLTGDTEKAIDQSGVVQSDH
jgi:hypothetical protein